MRVERRGWAHEHDVADRQLMPRRTHRVGGPTRRVPGAGGPTRSLCPQTRQRTLDALPAILLECVTLIIHTCVHASQPQLLSAATTRAQRAQRQENLTVSGVPCSPAHATARHRTTSFLPPCSALACLTGAMTRPAHTTHPISPPTTTTAHHPAAHHHRRFALPVLLGSFPPPVLHKR